MQKNDECKIYCVDQNKIDEVKESMPGPEILQSLAEIFKALGDPGRIKIIRALSQKELCVCEIATLLEASVSAVSHQLRLLRNLRLVKYRREGKMVHYALDDEHIVNLFREGLEHVEHTNVGTTTGEVK